MMVGQFVVPIRHSSLAAVAAFLVACAPHTARTGIEANADSTLPAVAEAFLSPMQEADNIDSPAAWRHPDGSTWVIATAKAADQLVVYDGDDGRVLQRVGHRGEAPGQFRRPNGVFVLDDLLFVVERDGRRVQLLRLPAFEPLAAFGNDILIKPYGLWATAHEEAIDLYVTDAYMAGEDAEGEDIAPPLSDLDERVKRFRVEVRGDAVKADWVASFGDTGAGGALRVVESIWGDPEHDRLMIAEEDETYANEIKVYDLAGRYAGRTIGGNLFEAQAEGIAMIACADGSGFWLTTEQGKGKTLFHLFARRSLDHAGSFSGLRVANTDGIWLHQAGTTRFPDGVLYAVHDDQGLVGFDWREIARVTGIAGRCAES